MTIRTLCWFYQDASDKVFNDICQELKLHCEGEKKKYLKWKVEMRWWKVWSRDKAAYVKCH